MIAMISNMISIYGIYLAGGQCFLRNVIGSSIWEQNKMATSFNKPTFRKFVLKI